MNNYNTEKRSWGWGGGWGGWRGGSLRFSVHTPVNSNSLFTVITCQVIDVSCRLCAHVTVSSHHWSNFQLWKWKINNKDNLYDDTLPFQLRYNALYWFRYQKYTSFLFLGDENDWLAENLLQASPPTYERLSVLITDTFHFRMNFKYCRRNQIPHLWLWRSKRSIN